MKYLFFKLSVIFLFVLFQSCETKREEPRRPNILFAIADDASWKHFSAYGCDWVKTPAFDRVASEGILFTRAYTPNAKCAPSRSCILTGRNSWQLEEATNHSPLFPAKFKTYAEALGENGYWVGSVAKGWAPGDPGEINGIKRQLTGPKFDEHKTTPPAKAISNNDYAKNFEAFLEARPEGKPFCFWYGSTEPHRAYEFEAGVKYGGKNLDEIDEIPPFWPDVDTIRTDMLDYAFEIEYFDSHLQMMLEKLEEIGELENTLVIVTADNGMPFPRIKGQVYEYSNHLPLAIMWPEGIKNPGRVVDDFVNFIDFTPTYLDVAGLTAEEIGMQKITGTSLTEIFNSEKEGLVILERDFVLVGKERHDVGRPDDQGYPVRGILTDDYLYIRNFKPDRWPKGNPETGYLNCDGSPTKTFILDSRRKKGIMEYWQLNFGKRVAEELYNIVEDPFCMNNLAENEGLTELKTKMAEMMKQKLTEQGDPRILGNGDIFDNYPYTGAVQNYYNRFMGGEKIPAGWVSKTDYDSDLMEE
ncbi:MAG: sulfatase [Prolixibacteraceae bacterium]|jgi:N-sulfoglucosamine sulfohydrolase|nr:sulfatase [Prolixibacteraceae bacterium]MBT6004359.1 sulfatase [Prolixibacteraceae bacterium]MBT6764072.1 sulfatase [Prolixibacteraceae bacterium]MBT6999326.1 sulfatase [Prolixibacteraceae bacterium]MBT7396209.1 sulfatase [Prolixibacteraceae bacterium]